MLRTCFMFAEPFAKPVRISLFKKKKKKILGDDNIFYIACKEK